MELLSRKGIVDTMAFQNPPRSPFTKGGGFGVALYKGGGFCFSHYLKGEDSVPPFRKRGGRGDFYTYDIALISYMQIHTAIRCVGSTSRRPRGRGFPGLNKTSRQIGIVRESAGPLTVQPDRFSSLWGLCLPLV